MPENDLDVSLVLPIYNERDHILTELDRIRAAMDASEFSYEMICVDDGSTDGSADVLATVPDIRLIRLTRNRGSGTARRIGSQSARGRVVVWTDIDMSYPNDQIPQLVRDLEGYDMVVGARRTEEGTKKALRVPAKWLIRQLAQYLSETTIPDLNTGFRAFRRDVADQYLHHLPTGFSCVTTLTMSFLSGGYDLRFVDIDYFPRAGESKFHWWKDTRRYVTQVVRMSLSYTPLRVFMPLGLLVTLLALTKMVYDWTTRDFSLATNTVVLFFAAFNVFSIGLLADLVVRVNQPVRLVAPASVLDSEPRPAAPAQAPTTAAPTEVGTTTPSA